MNLRTSARSAVLLGLFTASGVALAGQTLTGTYLTAHYGDDGMWNWSSTGMGLVYTAGSGTSSDATYPGTPWTHFGVEYDQSGSSEEYVANSTYTDTITIDSESDLSDTSTLVSVYEYTAGDLEITKVEYWEVGGNVISQQLVFTNTGTTDVENLRFQFATDPDIDADTYGDYSTQNDVDDLDGDGVEDWVVSVGPSSGIAMGFAPCEPDAAYLGHDASWSRDVDLTLSDDDGDSGDDSMNWVHTVGTLAAGDTVAAAQLIVVADDELTAEGLVTSEWDLCDICDADGDGDLAQWCGGDDCDDDDASVYPGADEYCDTIDNDCDGDIDEDDAVDAVTYYTDSDADGYGDAATGAPSCTQPSGTVEDAADCDDGDAAVNPGATEVCDGLDNDCDGDIDDADSSVDTSTGSTWYTDADADGFGDASTGVLACSATTGQVADDTDCDDTDAAIHPDAQEVCDGDDVDEDCDGLSDDFDDSVDTSTFQTWYADTDADGFGDAAATGEACDPGPGWSGDDTDCDDTSADTYPGATEICDGLDNDCDASVPPPELDADADGIMECDGDCDDADATVFPGATELEDDGIDQDCDGEDAVSAGGDDGGDDGGDGGGGDSAGGGDDGGVDEDSDGLSGGGGGGSKDGCSTAGDLSSRMGLGVFALLLPLFARRRRS